MLIGSLTYSVSIALQLLAIVLALRLIPLTGRAKAWLVFSAAFVLMGARRAIELLEHFDIIRSGIAFDNLHDFIALTTSILIVLGIYLIREVFEEQQQAEENTALRNQIVATQTDETKS